MLGTLEFLPEFTEGVSGGFDAVLKEVMTEEVEIALKNYDLYGRLGIQAAARRDNRFKRLERPRRFSSAESRAAKIERLKEYYQDCIDNHDRNRQKAQGVLSKVLRSAQAIAIKAGLQDDELIYMYGLGPLNPEDGTKSNLFNPNQAAEQLKQYRLMVPGARLLIRPPNSEIWAPFPDELTTTSGVLAFKPRVYLNEGPVFTPLIDMQFEDQRLFSVQLNTIGVVNIELDSESLAS